MYSRFSLTNKDQKKISLRSKDVLTFNVCTFLWRVYTGAVVTVIYMLTVPFYFIYYQLHCYIKKSKMLAALTAEISNCLWRTVGIMLWLASTIMFIELLDHSNHVYIALTPTPTPTYPCLREIQWTILKLPGKTDLG
jgi:hypothetical protein